jgi:stage IV sporulation protein FB
VDPIRFRALGFPVRVEPTFFLTVAVALLFQLADGGPVILAFTWGAVVFVSVLVHELGHALAARGLNVAVGTISLHALGGQVETGRTTPGRSLVVSLAGPGAGFVLGAATYAVLPWLAATDLGASIAADLLWVNVGWSLFNLLPMYPLDGGNALRSGLSLGLRERQAWRITSGVGVLLGGLVMLAGWQLGAMVMTWLGAFAAWTNWQIFNSD